MTIQRKPNHAKASSAEPPSAPIAHKRGRCLCSQNLGALPILNRLLKRTRLEEFLLAALSPHDARTKLSPAKALLVLLRNLLVSREPIYGVGEWAARHAPDLLGLAPVPGRARLPLADSATSDRPVRARATAHADTSPAFR
jgi:hypothetical protein